MENRLEGKIRSLSDAVSNLLGSIELKLSDYDDIAADAIKSGQIQKFEFSVELLWKTLKLYIFEVYGEDIKTPKLVLKKTLELELFDYSLYEITIDMLNWRNELSHLYDQEHFEDIRLKIIAKKEVWKILLDIFI